MNENKKMVVVRGICALLLVVIAVFAVVFSIPDVPFCTGVAVLVLFWLAGCYFFIMGIEALWQKNFALGLIYFAVASCAASGVIAVASICLKLLQKGGPSL